LESEYKEHIQLFRSLFRGRDDVFAIRWEKGNKSGYMPAYFYDPYRYRLHKINGGTFKDFTEKSYLSLSDPQISKHLNGEQLIGIYPLLQDNTSWFIIADFDKENWQQECKDFILLCESNNIPAYLERSRSGNGGHVWIFFEAPYPAAKSRTIFKQLLEESGTFSIFDKTSSFDRLFPNQDFLSGKGLGNLIALPLHNPNIKQGNSCFIDPKSLVLYENQWDFLKQIKRIKTAELDVLYRIIVKNDADELENSFSRDTLVIRLDNEIRINKTGLTTPLVNFIKDTLNVANPDYFIKKKIGRTTWSTNRYFNLVSESKNEVLLPRGTIGQLLRFCNKQKIDFEFQDKRKKSEDVPFTFGTELLEHQKIVLSAISKKDFGVITAPPGSGKTIIGLKIIAEKCQTALIVVHRKQLMDQWMERIEAFLKIPKTQIGKIGQGKVKIGKQVTIAMIQSLGKKIDNPEISKIFKTVIIDECHHIPAQSYAATVSRLFPYYLYGLTATPFRKNSDGKLIFAHLGELIADIKPQDIETFKKARVIIRNTNLDVPFNAKTDTFETLSKVLVHDSDRNKRIVDDITSEVNAGKHVVVITERKEHITTLYQFLKQQFEVVSLSGDDSESDRSSKWKILNEGNYQILITTGQFFGEGTDLKNVTCLFLVYPFSFKGKLIQYIGRVQRSEIAPLIYDYRDYKIEYLNRLFLKRNTYYRNLDRQATLFDDTPAAISKTQASSSMTATIKVPIDQLDFRFGTIAFTHKSFKLQKELEFEIENDYIRPEFEVLKPYFIKVMDSKNVEIKVSAEFENNVLVAQLATSRDLERINREVLESIRFRLLEKSFFSKKSNSEKESYIEQDKERIQALYPSEQELLEEVLSKRSVKHFRQLRYLADNHAHSILKLRFVLHPFSFVFLLLGNHQFHVILETLDTEEATYIWHFDKNISFLKEHLASIDSALNTIRNQGRQFYLESQPVNFSRIIHDYSDDRKGFIQWRDELEEKLY
jgi:superfamily II DNA or RNA helicase